MDDDRTVLTDEMREWIGDPPFGKATDSGVTTKDDRNSVEGVYVRDRLGATFRSVSWTDSVSVRFRRRVRAGISGRVFRALSDDLGPGHVSVDGTVVQARRKMAGANGEPGTVEPGDPAAT